jgi:hypothetical protein
MLAVRRFFLGSSLLALCVVACDRSQPVEPAVQAASTGKAGPTVKAPSNTNAVAESESRIDISWQDNSPNESGFEVHRSTAGASGAFTLLGSTGAGGTSHSDAGLTASTQYCYKVRAFKTADGKTSYSGFSNTACATTPAPPPPPPQPGSIQVTTATTGSYLDPDGYFVRVDGGPDQPIGTNATITIVSVSGGDHTVWLGGVAPNCSVDGANPRSVSVNGGTTEAAFPVTCGSGASLQVTTVTTGVDLDANGYHVGATKTCWGTLECLTCPACGGADVPVNGTVTISALESADYLVELSGVASNCGGGDWARIVAVPGAVRFDVACAPIQPGTEVCDNGLDDDGDGLTDSEDPDCQRFCQYSSCLSEECSYGLVCDTVGCCVPHCGDGVQNGDESDLDCGGFCGPCQSGQSCYSNSDCASFSCVNHICQP